MPRNTVEMRTSLSRDQAWSVISEYLTGEGFDYRDEKGEIVWRKGAGLATIPQFIKAIPADGAVHIEAWLATVSWVPGVYTGEQGLDGPWGFAIKSALKKRLAELERRLGGGIVSQGKTGAPVPVQQAYSPQAAAPQAAAAAPASPGTVPATWSPDPTGRHQLRYWDGSAWTDNVSDAGVVSQDPV